MILTEYLWHLMLTTDLEKGMNHVVGKFMEDTII